MKPTNSATQLIGNHDRSMRADLKTSVYSLFDVLRMAANSRLLVNFL